MRRKGGLPAFSNSTRNVSFPTRFAAIIPICYDVREERLEILRDTQTALQKGCELPQEKLKQKLSWLQMFLADHRQARHRSRSRWCS